jgi:hypothetical protein
MESVECTSVTMTIAGPVGGLTKSHISARPMGSGSSWKVMIVKGVPPYVTPETAAASLSEIPTIKIRFSPDPVVCDHDKVTHPRQTLELAESKVINETACVLGNTIATTNNDNAVKVKQARKQ